MPMPSAIHRDPPSGHRRVPWRHLALVLLLVLLVAAGGWWLTQRPQPTVVAAVPAAARASGAVAPMPAPPPPAAEAEPAPSDRPLAPTELASSLESLLGRDAVLRLLQTTDLPRRIVATVDNLARESAPASVWPVNPAAGRFQVVRLPDGRLQADPDNGLRYTPLVLLAEGIDTGQLAAWYRQALPALQQAYAALGYPGQRFHGRLLAVLDHLLATPPAPQPLLLQLTEVRGPVLSASPWLRYEFADLGMEQASAGRKILWRVGPVNQRRLLKVLGSFREAITTMPR
jgi:hypothetical protein